MGVYAATIAEIRAETREISVRSLDQPECHIRELPKILGILKHFVLG